MNLPVFISEFYLTAAYVNVVFFLIAAYREAKLGDMDDVSLWVALALATGAGGSLSWVLAAVLTVITISILAVVTIVDLISSGIWKLRRTFK